MNTINNYLVELISRLTKEEKEEYINYIHAHQDITHNEKDLAKFTIEFYNRTNELLHTEFVDCINSDPDFNYSENEFEEWKQDLVTHAKITT